LGVPAIAVGLSAISFSASLQKDAASIPNAMAMSSELRALNPIALSKKMSVDLKNKQI